MTDIDESLALFETKYPGLFRQLRVGGWTPERRVPGDEVALEPHWPTPFPMHRLAAELLARFAGVYAHDPGWPGVRFGCRDADLAEELKMSRPFDIERLVLREPSSDRPPAFPIGTMNEAMIFLREDWSTITVGYNWRHMLLTNEPFEAIEETRKPTGRLWNDPARHIVVTDEEQVPYDLIPTWMTT